MIRYLFIMGVVILGIGLALIVLTRSIRELQLDYTACSASAPSQLESTGVPSGIDKWKYDVGNKTCTVQFQVPETMAGPVYMYYRLTNFNQNYRQFLRSVNYGQLQGEALSREELASERKGNCEPLVGPASDAQALLQTKVYYPCGLLANAFFSDRFGPLEGTDGQKEKVDFPAQDLAWPHEREFYKQTKYTRDQIEMPPAWKEWNTDEDWFLNLHKDERFMVWMRPAPFAAFRKEYGRLAGSLQKGTYNIEISDHFQVRGFGGTKSIVITTGTVFGLSRSYAFPAICVLFGFLQILAGAAVLYMHMKHPRRAASSSDAKSL